MRRSEIFDSFVKIAQDKGLISEDAPEKAKKKLESNPRADSLDIKDIEALYGVKPDAPKSMEYKRNIIEDAHPESVVISPSYDKLNGLVENNNERQDIILHIVNKTPNGHLIQKKYAEKELLLSLVRLGNDLDNRNEEKLMVLADTCLQQVNSYSLKKEAAVQAIIAGLAVAIGALWIQQHSDFYNQGFETNHKKLLAELEDFLSSNSDYGVGYKYKPEFISTVNEFKEKINNFKQVMDENMSVIKDMQKPRTGSELLKAVQSGNTNQVQEAYKKVFDEFKEFLPYLNQIKDNFSSTSYKEEQIADKGFITSLIDSSQFLHGGKGLVADDFDDVVRALGPYIKSVADPKTGYLALLVAAQSKAKKAQADLTRASAQTSQVPTWQAPSVPIADNAETKPSSVQTDEEDLASALRG